MSWSYSGDPATSALDALRFLIQDTDTTAQLLSNEELSYLLSEENDSVYAAAIRAALQLGARLGRKGSIKVGDLAIDYTQQAKWYNDLAAQLRRERILRTGSGAGVFTAESKTDKQAREDDTDRVQPKFSRDLGDVQNFDSRGDDDPGV